MPDRHRRAEVPGMHVHFMILREDQDILGLLQGDGLIQNLQKERFVCYLVLTYCI